MQKKCYIIGITDFLFFSFAFGLFHLPIRVIGRIYMWTVTIWSTLLPWVPQALHTSWQNDTIPVVSSLINQSRVEKGGLRMFYHGWNWKGTHIPELRDQGWKSHGSLSPSLPARHRSAATHARLGPSCPSEYLRGRWSVCERGCSKFQEKLDCWYNSKQHWAAVLPSWRAFMGSKVLIFCQTWGSWCVMRDLWSSLIHWKLHHRGQKPVCSWLCLDVLGFFQILLFWLTWKKNVLPLSAGGIIDEIWMMVWTDLSPVRLESNVCFKYTSKPK